MTPSASASGRRGFIKLVGFFGLAAGMAIAAGRRGLTSLGLARVVRTRPLMGTYLQIVLYAEDQPVARQAADLALRRMQGFEALLSRHRSDSALSRLNIHGYLDRPPAALVDLLGFSHRVSLLTSGAFDLSIEPLARVIRQASTRGLEPTSAEIRQVAHLIDYTAIEADARRVRLTRQGMAITPDGVGKGFILDEGLRVLNRLGFGGVMLDAGGDIVVSRGLGDPAWHVGIQDPRGPAGQLIASVSLSDGAIATSGDYLHSYTLDHRLNHILDPRTGVSPTQLSSASVIAPTAAMADALSTGMMVLGVAQSLELARAIPGVECLLVTKAGERMQSEGFATDRPG